MNPRISYGVFVRQTEAGFVMNAVVMFIVFNADHFFCQAPEAAAEPHRWADYLGDYAPPPTYNVTRASIQYFYFYLCLDPLTAKKSWVAAEVSS